MSTCMTFPVAAFKWMRFGPMCRRNSGGSLWITDEDDPERVGDMWTFVALDADTKLVPTYRVGKRDLRTASAFLDDLARRLVNRVQLSSDALRAYVEATEQAFGADVDYGQIVKFYE